MGSAEGFPFRGWQKLLLTNHILKISEWGYHPRIRFEIFRTGFEGDKNARTEVGKTPRTPLWKFQHGVRGWGSFAGGKNGRTRFWKFQNWIRQVTTNFLTTHQQTTSDRNVETQSIAKMNPPRCYYFRNSVIPHGTIMLKRCNVLTFANAIEPASA